VGDTTGLRRIDYLGLVNGMIRGIFMREVQIVPKTIKTLPNGTKVVVYNWQGAERAKITKEEETVFVGHGIGFIGQIKITNQRRLLCRRAVVTQD